MRLNSLYLSFIPAVAWLCMLGADTQDDNQAVRRIHAHVTIRDYRGAYAEASQALKQYPQSASIQEAYIKCLARLGQEKEMLSAWQCYVTEFPDKKENREVLEAMCWGVLDKASSSASVPIRLMSLLAAYFSQDIKGVNILYQGMTDSNSIIRAASVQLSGRMHDTKLKDQVKKLFREEKVWLVRQQILKSIGQMDLEDMCSHLEAVIASEKTSAEEKILAIESWIELVDDISKNEVIRLASSNRAGLRLLACQLIGHFESYRDIDQLIQLAKDNRPEVRAAALQVMGVLRPRDGQRVPVVEIAESCLADRDALVGISAAWLLTLYQPTEGQQAFEAYLNHVRPEVRALASSALGSTGRYGAPLSSCYVLSHPDPYVRLNLALGLANLRYSTEAVVHTLKDGLTSEQERWCWKEEGIFRCLLPHRLHRKHTEFSSVTPEMANQLVRLEILNLLAILEPSEALGSIRQFLSNRSWGISGVAAALLLTEGDDAAVDLVQRLLEDEESKVRLQAALVLSLWGREEKAIQTLEKGYWTADRELKEKILESLARIGSMHSVPFLMQVLKEPSQSLRVIAATALIRCLNH